MIQVEKRHLKIIQNILKKYSYGFYVYGSRAKKTARKFSDLDLCYKKNIPPHVVVEIEGTFEDSDLPFKVEVVSWKRLTREFQQRIEKDFVPIGIKPSQQRKCSVIRKI